MNIERPIEWTPTDRAIDRKEVGPKLGSTGKRCDAIVELINQALGETGNTPGATVEPISHPVFRKTP